MRLGEKHSNPDPDYSHPVHVEFCREDPVIYLLAKRNVNIGRQTHWFGRDLTQHERKLEYEARKKRRERQKEMRPTDSSNTNESDNGKEPVRGPNNEQNWHQLDHHNLKIFYMNACSLFNKLTEIRSIVSYCKYDIICITEKHYSSDYSSDYLEVGIPNYRLYRKDRDANGGGSCIYVHVKHAAQLMGGFCLPDSLGVTLALDSGDVHLICIYRPPCSTNEQDRRMREQLYQLPSSDRDHVFILGDFNLPNVCWCTGSICGPNGTSDKNLQNQKDFIHCFTYCGFTWHIADEITRRRMVNDVLQESTTRCSPRTLTWSSR